MSAEHPEQDCSGPGPKRQGRCLVHRSRWAEFEADRLACDVAHYEGAHAGRERIFDLHDAELVPTVFREGLPIPVEIIAIDILPSGVTEIRLRYRHDLPPEEARRRCLLHVVPNPVDIDVPV